MLRYADSFGLYSIGPTTFPAPGPSRMAPFPSGSFGADGCSITTGGRFGGKTLLLNGIGTSSAFFKVALSPGGAPVIADPHTAFVGFALKITSALPSEQLIVDWPNIRLWMKPNGLLEVRRATGAGLPLIVDSGAYHFPINDGNYHYLEMRYTSFPSGTVEVRVTEPGQPFTTVLTHNFTSVLFSISSVTVGAGNLGASTGLSDGGHFGGFTMQICDFYLCDDTGTLNNTFLGDVVVEPYGVAGGGTGTFFGHLNTYRQTGAAYLTPGCNFCNVALTPLAVGSGDFVQAFIYDWVIGDSMTYAIDAPVLGSSAPKGICVKPRMARNVANRKVKPMVVFGASQAFGQEFTATGSFINYHSVFETNPATGNPWTVAEFAASQIGVKITG